MTVVKFLSADWFAALSAAAEARTPPPDDPLADVAIVIEQRVVDGPRWQLAVDGGALTVRVDPDQEADVRLTSDLATAAAIAAGQEAALDAFMVGRLMVGGDVQRLVELRAAFEAIGDVFAEVREHTDFG